MATVVQEGGNPSGITPVGGSQNVFEVEQPSSITEQNQVQIDQGLIAGFGINSDVDGVAASNKIGKSNFSVSRTAQLAQLEISKRRLLFQQKTGLRDIKQARAQGLKGAINNALQRGIFKSGIRVENEKTVNRESDEAGSDLKADIALSLEALQAQKKGVSGQQFNPASGGLEGQVASGLLTPEQMHKTSVGNLAAENERRLQRNANRAGQEFRSQERSGTGIIAPPNKFTGGGGL